MTKQQQAGALVPIGEAAKTLKTKELNVLMHIKRGLLQGLEGAEGWQVTAASLTALVGAGPAEKSQEVCPPSCGKGGGCSSCK
jgi:hypothetical protein